MKFDIWVFFENMSRKFHSKRTKKKRVFYMKTNKYFWTYLAQFFIEWEMLSDKSSRENPNTHFMFNNFSQKSNRVWYNVETCCTARQATDSNTRFACWMSKATDIHSEYVILIAFPRQQRFRERVSMNNVFANASEYSVYKHTACLVLLNTFAASYLNTQGLNNSCLKSPASTLVDLTFQSRARSALSA